MSLDYNKPITIKDINLVDYNAKFEFVDNAKKQKVPSKKDYRKIFNDVTMFSYFFFRLDDKPLKLYPYQDMILNDPHRFIYFRASNQIGKSISLDVDAAYNLVIDHGKGYTMALVSRSLPQATEQMRRIKLLLNTAKFEWSESKGISDNMSVITIDIKEGRRVKYTNTLVCCPCSETILGYALDDSYYDEFEFWDINTEYFYNQYGESRTFKTNGNIKIFTNPNGSDNFGSNLENQVLPDGNKKFHTYTFNFLDCPGNTPEKLELAKVGKTRQQIESTLLAIRSMSDRCFFTADEIEKSYDSSLSELKIVGKQPFFFLDVGAKHDQSCLVGGFIEPDVSEKFNHLYLPIIHLYPVGYPLTRVAGVNVDDSDGWHYEKSVKEYLEEYSQNGVLPVFGFDVTGNQGMVPLFEAIGINAQDVVFSGPSKSGYYVRFKYFMEKGLLHRIKHKEWEKQAADLIVTKSSRGYLLINAHGSQIIGGSDVGKKLDARLKKTPDDALDATAGLISLADPYLGEVYSMKVFTRGE